VNGKPLNWVVGGEIVTLKIYAQAHQELVNPIVGFSIKDHRGQALFGDNTYLSYADASMSCDAGSDLEAEFTFAMPILPAGDYSVGAAIATGTQEMHVQHHWLHDALIFKSEASSVATGLMGIPMQDIKLTTRD
jgi:lipopolysaccharide transport system ATP-binding protein